MDEKRKATDYSEFYMGDECDIFLKGWYWDEYLYYEASPTLFTAITITVQL